MSLIDLPPSETTPSVRFDPASSTLRLEGESYPEDVVAFYGPVVSWLRDYLSSATSALTVQFALRYINTSSSKALLDLLLVLDDHYRSGGIVAVEWHYDPAVEVMQEAGEEFGEDLALPFSLIALN